MIDKLTKEYKNLTEFLRHGTPQSVIERYLSLEEIAESSSFGELDSNVVIVDTEATGLSFKKDDLIQIAAARLTNGQIEDWFVTFVNPGIEISEEIEHLTHISNDDIADAPGPDEALTQLVDFCGDAVMLAHNAEFDKGMLTKHVNGYPLLDNIWVDSLDLVRICFPRLTSHRLIDLSRAFTLIESTHRADDDVATTVLVYRLCLAAITCMPRNLIRCIANLAEIDMWPTAHVYKVMLELLENNELDSNIDTEQQASEFEQDLFAKDPSLGKLDMFSMFKGFRCDCINQIPKKSKSIVKLAESEFDEINGDIVETNEDDMMGQIYPESLQFITQEELQSHYTKQGTLGKIYDDFEPREEQRQMSARVLDSFSNCENCVIEAGTGVGKSMAYLIPAAKTAIENNISIGVSTKTNALLDQLIYHELPALKSQFPQLSYSPLKGSKHYICLRKAALLAGKKAKMVTFKNETHCNAASVAGLISFVEQTEYDDCDGLKINSRALFASQYTTPSYECLRHRCPFYRNGCFVHGARRIAENSDLVITNHTLTLCDINADGGILPPIKYWIIDEAHGLESEAREVFCHEISSASLLDFAKSLRSDKPALNPFVKCLHDASSKETTDNEEDKQTVVRLVNKCMSLAKSFSDVAELFANRIDILQDFAESSNSGYENIEIWINNKVRESEQFNELFSISEQLSKAAEELVTGSINLTSLIETYQSLTISMIEIQALTYQIKRLIEAIDVIFFNNSDKYVYSAHLNLKNNTRFNRLEAQLFSVGEELRDGFYNNSNSIIFTSATLAIGENFEPYFDNVGLDYSTPSLKLNSSFDYDNNMTIYVASDLPFPKGNTYQDFTKALPDFLADLHVSAGGSILTLFTNRREMENCHEYVADIAKNHNLRILCQRYKLSMKSARDEFMSEDSVSLFALKSFWEGFDAPGDTLKGVVITKLPFSLPSKPLNQQRREMVSNSWTKFSLPESVIDVKQAVGRLIRKSTDTGYIVFCDSRVANMGYGQQYLDSMPTKNIKIMCANEIVDDIYKNYSK